MEFDDQSTAASAIDAVWARLAEPRHPARWFRGLNSIDPISGDPGAPGAQQRIHASRGSVAVELIETVLAHSPYVYDVEYKSDMFVQRTRVTLAEVDAHTTLVHLRSSALLTNPSHIPLFSVVVERAVESAVEENLARFKQYLLGTP
ncbi:SRPBCC family protein [Humidisolicoccus flavus]|uniref:SRPBCC family protein n=1 Tax=Humidisolicoccus flavus TaxID=3111414 RepID=UPI00324F4C8F